MATADGRGVRRPAPEDLVPLPPGSDLFLLPGRRPLGFPRRRQGREPVVLEHGRAVAAFLAPAWVRHALPAWEREPDAPLLPLYAYCAVGFSDDRFWVPAERVDPDVRQDLDRFDLAALQGAVNEALAAAPEARLLRHVAECAIERACPAARNYFFGRWEAPLPTSPGCNSACVGCISEQPDDLVEPRPCPGRVRGEDEALDVVQLDADVHRSGVDTVLDESSGELEHLSHAEQEVAHVDEPGHLVPVELAAVFDGKRAWVRAA